MQILSIIWGKGGVRVWACMSATNSHFKAAMTRELRLAKMKEPRMDKLMLDLKCALLSSLTHYWHRHPSVRDHADLVPHIGAQP